MTVSQDMQLLQDYASGKSEEAFATLVSRHINLVYSAALRRVGNPHQAEEITQAVFVTLAKKAGHLNRATILSGWLYQTARLTAGNFLRTEIRRQHREQEAHMQSIVNEPEPELWKQVGPILDEAMAQLNETDRNAIVLRYFEGKALKEVGAALGTTDDAAKMRINRAIEKMRAYFLQRGITLTPAGLAAVIGENSVQAAPAELAASVTLGVAKSVALTASTLTIAGGTLKLMAWSKLNIAISVAAIAIAAVEWRQVSTAQHKTAQVQEQLQRLTQLNQIQQAEIAQADEQNAFLQKQIQSAAHDTAKARNHNSMAQAAKGNRPDVFADFRKNPEMMAALRDSSVKEIKRLYAPLVRKLDLPSDQADKFYQMLVDEKMNSSFSKSEMMATGGDTAGLEKIGLDAEKQMNNNLQALLGEADYAVYKDYQSSIPQREALDQMRDDFADNPLTADQQQHLLEAMAAAGQALAPNHGLETFSVTDSTAGMDRKIQQQEAINQRVLIQASAFLSPAQLQTLGSSQSNVIAMTKAGYAMAQKMFGTQTAGK